MSNKENQGEIGVEGMKAAVLAKHPNAYVISKDGLGNGYLACIAEQRSGWFRLDGDAWADAYAKLPADASPSEPQEQPRVDRRGGSFYLTREQWGYVCDGLIAQRETLLKRKRLNPESNADESAQEITEVLVILKPLSEAAPTAAGSEEPPLDAFDLWWNQYALKPYALQDSRRDAAEGWNAAMSLTRDERAAAPVASQAPAPTANRYKMEFDGCVKAVTDPDGGWVLFGDYAWLEGRVRELETDMRFARKIIDSQEAVLVRDGRRIAELEAEANHE